MSASARKKYPDERWLQRRHQCWYVIQEIPRAIRHAFPGPTGRPLVRLVQSLHTDVYEVAKAKRHAVLAEFARRFESARGNRTHESTVAAAIDWRAHAVRQTDPVEQIIAQQDIEGSAAEIADPASRAIFLDIAEGRATPFESFAETWLSEQDIEARSRGDHRRSIGELIAWTKQQSIPPTVEAFDRRTAGRYVSHLLGQGLDRSTTARKRLWSLSRFWAWLEQKGYAGANVWRGHDLGRKGRSARDKQPERPFTTAEIQALLGGTPRDPTLPDLMRVALLCGARLEELALLRVRDVDPTERTLAILADPKTEASRRVVPIHSAIWPIIAARMQGKAADAFVFHELGNAPKEGRERSMAVSKAFGRYRKRLGVDDKREGQRRGLVNFHSFRRTFVTLAEQAGQPESTIRSVVGHKRQGMTFGVYSGGPSLAQRRACVAAVAKQLQKAGIGIS